jgi:UDP-N-acetyl-D-mannosaminuronic acid dehydrogenase
MHVPGAGVGGHCLPKDPWLLVQSARAANPRLIPTARAVNDSMPFHVLDLAASALQEAGKTVEGAVIAVMGASFLQDSGDARNSPSVPVIESLRNAKELRVHDPFLDDIAGVSVIKDWRRALDGADLAIFMVSHKQYAGISAPALKKFMRTPVVVDGRNIFSAERMMRAGIVYRGVGKKVNG